MTSLEPVCVGVGGVGVVVVGVCGVGVVVVVVVAVVVVVLVVVSLVYEQMVDKMLCNMLDHHIFTRVHNSDWSSAWKAFTVASCSELLLVFVLVVVVVVVVVVIVLVIVVPLRFFRASLFRVFHVPPVALAFFVLVPPSPPSSSSASALPTRGCIHPKKQACRTGLDRDVF